MMCLPTNRRSHSTCWLKESANFVFKAVDGPGFCHSRHTEQVWQTSGIKSKTFWGTPTLSRTRFMVCSLACHHRTCSLRSGFRIERSLFALSTRTTFPMSKFDQSLGLSGFAPSSRNAFRSRGTLPGPLTARASFGPDEDEDGPEDEDDAPPSCG